MRIKVRYFDNYMKARDFMDCVIVLNYGVVPGSGMNVYYVMYK